MSSGIITAIAGLVVALSALIANLFSYWKIRAETDKIKAETEQIRSDTAEVGSRAANAETIARHAFQAAPGPQSLMLYDSHNGFSLFDFRCEFWEGATGELSLASSAGMADDILVITRNNTEGRAVLWLKSYGYKDRPNVIPVGDVAGTKRMFRIRCEVRTHSAERTLLPTLKMQGAPPGHYLSQRRLRLRPGSWIDIDEHFDASFSASCELRFYDRSISAAPSRLEIRNLVVTEREPPRKLLPGAGGE